MGNYAKWFSRETRVFLAFSIKDADNEHAEFCSGRGEVETTDHRTEDE